ncbi:MAG: glycosyltransferase family 2 protein [Bacteroidota bacterium]
MTPLIDIIYCYKNKDISRVKKSLDSLSIQDNKAFRVIFIDYGSDSVFAEKIENLCQQYAFCNYRYVNSLGQMWNRGDALNYGFKLSDAPYVFTSDIDMVYKNNFISYLLALKTDELSAYFFAVGYLNEKQSNLLTIRQLEKLTFTRSENYALGMMFVSKEVIERINGYNSFYAIWGIEDNDIKRRIENAGLKTGFVDKEILMLHQYHPVSNGANLPAGWQQYLKDYNDQFFEFNGEFNGLKQLQWPRLRPSLDVLKNNDIVFRKLHGRKLHIRHCILNDLTNHLSVKTLKYEIELSEHNYPSHSTIFKFITSLNAGFELMNVPIRLTSLFKEQYLSKKDVYDEIYFLLKSLEHAIEDYYLNDFENKITLVIVKK